MSIKRPSRRHGKSDFPDDHWGDAIAAEAPAFIGGEPNDMEIREIMKLGKQIEKTLHPSKYGSDILTISVIVACNEYYTT